LKKLERKLTLSSVIAISIAGMLGTGIFVLPGVAAGMIGEYLWLAYILSALFILPSVFSKSELATAMPQSGGTYIYIERAFGPLFGTISGIGLWASLILKSSFALIGFGAYLLAVANIGLDIKYLSIGFLIIIFMLNVLGVKKVGKVQLIIIALGLLFLIALLGVGITKLDINNTNFDIPSNKQSLLATIAFVYLSYAGVTKIAAVAGEVKNPSRNLPLAMITSLLIMTVIYGAVAFILTEFVSPEALKKDYRPIYTLAENLSNHNVYVGYSAAIIGILTLISLVNSGVLASSRFPFAMAKDKLLPNYMTYLHPKYLTPIIAIAFTCIMMAVVVIYVDVVKIAKLASAFKITMFIAVNACVIVLRETGVQWYKPTYKSPFYPLTQILGIIGGFILLFYLGWMPFIAIIIISLLGTAIYFFYGKKRSMREGIITKYGNRPALYMLYGGRKDFNLMQDNFEKKQKKEKLENEILSNAGAIVPLLGNERSPEILTEIAGAITKNKKVQTIHVTEVPDQTFLDDEFFEKDPKAESINRQLTLLEKDKKIQINFKRYRTHNLTNTVQSLSEQTHCDWLVLGWNGVDHQGILINNPIGWLVTNVDSNVALFKDNGIKYINKILLAILPQKDNSKFIEATNMITEFYHTDSDGIDADFTVLHIIPNDTQDSVELEIKSRTEEILKKYPQGNLSLVRHENPEKYISEISVEYDLLIIGTPKHNDWASILFGTGKDKFVENAACSVLRLTIKN